jgi:archaellum component FlaF (FlaF/FlaG flagellin family)
MKSYHTICLIIIGILCAILLVSCNNEKDGAVKAVEAYIQALSNKDTEQISVLSCADWEQNALIEVDSLTAVGSKVENLACTEVGQDGEDTYVSCTGYLALDYNGEAQQIDLSNRTYIARLEDGEWRMCGYH